MCFALPDCGLALCGLQPKLRRMHEGGLKLSGLLLSSRINLTSMGHCRSSYSLCYLVAKNFCQKLSVTLQSSMCQFRWREHLNETWDDRSSNLSSICADSVVICNKPGTINMLKRQSKGFNGCYQNIELYP